MMIRRPVQVLDRDICLGHADLAVVPCSGKLKGPGQEKDRNQKRIDEFGLPAPKSFDGVFSYGMISPLMVPTKNTDKVDFLVFAASVHNKSEPYAIESIGQQLGKLTVINPRIRLIDAPFLGCGDGGLMPSIAMRALAQGFLDTRHPDAVLQLCSDNAISFKMAEHAIEDLFRQLGNKRARPKKKSRPTPYDYDIVLSFSGEQRGYIQSLTYLLKSHGVSVFYDNDEQADLWGRNLYDFLHDIYSKRSRYCLIAISKSYAEREWTNHERKAAQSRAFKEIDAVYILPLRFDDTEIPGLPQTVGYIDQSIGVEGVFDLIMKKLNSTSN